MWVDGVLRTRGENQDYIIDYSTGELTFMSRVLIHSDTDIFVEYEYRDGTYSRSLTGANVSRNFGSGIHVGLDWTRDGDNLNSGTLSPEDRDALSQTNSGYISISTVTADSAGDYTFNGNTYEYHPTASDSVQHFKLSFEADPDSGSYSRNISRTGQIFYTFVPEADRVAGQILYSPVHRLQAPERLDFFTLQSSGPLGEHTDWSLVWHSSLHDNNILSQKSAGQQQGLGTSLKIDGEQTLSDQLTFRYGMDDWFRSADFTALSNDRDVRFYRDWNLTAPLTGSEHLTTIQTSLESKHAGKGAIYLDRYATGSQSRYRFRSETRFHTTWIPRLNLNTSYLQRTGRPFYQAQFNTALLPTRIHPVFLFETEQAPDVSRFESAGTGLESTGKSSAFQINIHRRLDWTWQDSLYTAAATDWITALDWQTQIKRSWRVSLNGNHRRKTDAKSGSHFQSTMGQLQLNYRNPQRTVLWNWSSRLEESQDQIQAVVYDSVGPGLGQYRYDPVYEEYVADPNGAYIGTLVFTGERQPATFMDLKQRLEFRNFLKKAMALESSRLTFDAAGQFQGLGLSLVRWFNPDLNGQNTRIAKGAVSQDWDMYFKRHPIRLREWSRNSQDFEGLDPRGNDLKRDSELGIESQVSLSKNRKLTAKLSKDHSKTRSTVTSLRNRSSGSLWAEPGIKVSVPGKIRIDTGLKYAQGDGTQIQGRYSVTGKGIWLDGSVFIGKDHRIQIHADWFDSHSPNPVSDLPPEALKGYALGRSFRTQVQSVWMLGGNFHLNLSLNYMNDVHYKNFVQFSGEIRAYF